MRVFTLDFGVLMVVYCGFNFLFMEFELNKEYSDLLVENSNFHLKVRSGQSSYLSDEYKRLQKKLTAIEVKMPSEQIIKHAEILFPKVGPPN